MRYVPKGNMQRENLLTRASRWCQESVRLAFACWHLGMFGQISMLAARWFSHVDSGSATATVRECRRSDCVRPEGNASSTLFGPHS